MFCASGNVLMKYHTRDLSKIKGMLQASPLTAFLVVLGGLALAGMPPFNIFLSKFAIISGGIQAGYLGLMIVCLLFLAIVFAAFLRVISSAVFGDRPKDMLKGEIRAGSLVPLAVLAILILTLGLYMPSQVGHLLNEAAQVTGMEGTLRNSGELVGFPPISDEFP
jgi:hydrogenase-4 component F